MTTSLNLLQELIGTFYIKLGLDFRAKLVVGQICEAPVCTAMKTAPSGVLIRSTQVELRQTCFRQVPQPGDAYESKRILNSPQLGAHEEFAVTRAKRRPVIVLMPQQDEIEVVETRRMMKINKKLVLVAPCYGVVNAMQECKTDPEFLKRVSSLHYPHFTFLPKGGHFDKDSLLRLDSIHHIFHSQLEASQWVLAPEIKDIVLGQLERVLSIGNGDKFVTARDILLGK